MVCQQPIYSGDHLSCGEKSDDDFPIEATAFSHKRRTVISLALIKRQKIYQMWHNNVVEHIYLRLINTRGYVARNHLLNKLQLVSVFTYNVHIPASIGLIETLKTRISSLSAHIAEWEPIKKFYCIKL